MVNTLLAYRKARDHFLMPNIFFDIYSWIYSSRRMVKAGELVDRYFLELFIQGQWNVKLLSLIRFLFGLFHLP